VCVCIHKHKHTHKHTLYTGEDRCVCVCTHTHRRHLAFAPALDALLDGHLCALRHLLLCFLERQLGQRRRQPPTSILWRRPSTTCGGVLWRPVCCGGVLQQPWRSVAGTRQVREGFGVLPQGSRDRHQGFRATVPERGGAAT